MKFKIFFIFVLIFSSLPLCAMDHPSELDEELIDAVISGNAEQVESCLSDGADPNIKIDDAYHRPTVLIFSAENGLFEIVRLLLDYHANVAAQDDKGYTALTCAAANGHTKIIKTLLDHYAPVNVNNDDDMTPLAWCVHIGSTQLVNILLKHNADIYKPNKIGLTPLKDALEHHRTKIVELLLKHINHILDQTDNPKICQKWDQYVLDSLNEIEKEWRYGSYPIDTINTFRMILHHADKLPLSRKKFESLTIRTLEKRRSGEAAFRETVKHLRKHAF